LNEFHFPVEALCQEEWMAEATPGFASCKVADNVKTHEAWGLGISSFFGVRGGSDVLELKFFNPADLQKPPPKTSGR
jgi:hypothetical protein